MSYDELYAFRFPLWKRRFLRACFPGHHVHFVSNMEDVPTAGTLLVWGVGPPEVAAERPDIDVWRVEDGFLRSVGLGADYVRPLSWVVDRTGIYFDATRPSDLEILLSNADFDDVLLSRAANLREKIISSGLTKYNLIEGCWERPSGVSRVILVPGQVETDASIRYGAPDINNNIGLLKRVRVENPDAYLLYKPHPDVVAGLRRGGQGEGEALRWCDRVVENVSMGDLLYEVDEVHCLTSLTGFEALLRGRKVVCYGQPFYSGWGLTVDMLPIPRRARSLTLDELVAGVLILYPYYMTPKGGLITPEQALDELKEWRGRQNWYEILWRRIFRLMLRMFSRVT